MYDSYSSAKKYHSKKRSSYYRKRFSASYKSKKYNEFISEIDDKLISDEDKENETIDIKLDQKSKSQGTPKSKGFELENSNIFYNQGIETQSNTPESKKMNLNSHYT